MNYFSHGHACSTAFVPCNLCSEQEKAKKKFIPTFNKKLRVCVIHSCTLYRCARYTQINTVHPSSGSGQFIALARSPKLSYSYGYLVRTVMKSGTLRFPNNCSPYRATCLTLVSIKYSIPLYIIYLVLFEADFLHQISL